MKIAVLALQGAFIEHRNMLSRLGVESFEVRQAADWNKPKDGLIIPGGESTTQLKLLKDLGIKQRTRIKPCRAPDSSWRCTRPSSPERMGT